jgi:hypothetical protein
MDKIRALFGDPMFQAGFWGGVAMFALTSMMRAVVHQMDIEAQMAGAARAASEALGG